MYFTIQGKNNKPILRGLLRGFGIHTSATESNNGHTAFYACLSQVEGIEVLDEEQLTIFESLYRLDNNPKQFSNADTNKRAYYVFLQPKLRSDFEYMITLDGYRSNKHNINK